MEKFVIYLRGTVETKCSLLWKKKESGRVFQKELEVQEYSY